jgi:hypothetical protein
MSLIGSDRGFDRLTFCPATSISSSSSSLCVEMTRRILPVSGSRSTWTSSGSKSVLALGVAVVPVMCRESDVS